MIPMGENGLTFVRDILSSNKRKPNGKNQGKTMINKNRVENTQRNILPSGKLT